MTDTLIAGEQSTAAQGEAVTTETEAAKPAEGTATEQGADAAAKPEGEAKTEDAKPRAPESYEDFKLPEGVEIDTEITGDLKALAKELDLPQDAAQKFADLGAKMAQKYATQATEVFAQTVKDWETQTRADTEIGGDKLTETLATASKALTEFGSPALKDLLNKSGLGNHPEVIRAFAKIGKAISDDKVVTGAPTAGGVTAEAKLYPTMSKKD